MVKVFRTSYAKEGDESGSDFDDSDGMRGRAEIEEKLLKGKVDSHSAK